MSQPCGLCHLTGILLPCALLPADFSQTVDGASYLPLSAGATYATAAGVVSLRGCVDACRAEPTCAAATFAYYDATSDSETACYLWKPKSDVTNLADT
jgi:hypothetical protein